VRRQGAEAAQPMAEGFDVHEPLRL
jgi:hypothetical protein